MSSVLHSAQDNTSQLKLPEQPFESSFTPPGKSTERLALPAVGDNGIPKLDMRGGEGELKLDHLGPMVVGQDGTLSRISNWDQMTEMEQKNALRVLGKRNKQRLEALRAQEGKEGKQS